VQETKFLDDCVRAREIGSRIIKKKVFLAEAYYMTAMKDARGPGGKRTRTFLQTRYWHQEKKTSLAVKRGGPSGEQSPKRG